MQSWSVSKAGVGLRVVLLLAQVALAASAGVAAAQDAPPRRPNIIMILADDLGYEVLGANGGTSYRTPHLDRLAADGMRFERGYSTPLCTPTRVQLMTGKQNFRNYVSFGLLDPHERTFANHLRDAGYATAIAGKWQLGGDSSTPAHFGFDEHLLWQLHGPDFWTRYRDPVLSRTGGVTDTLTGRYGPDAFAEFIEGFIERNRDRPFLVYYPMVLVHDPFQPPSGHPEFRRVSIPGTNDTTYFAAMVSHMDGIVGRLTRKLEEAGVRDNTLILFMGDNGTDVNVTSRMGDRVIRGDKGNTTEAGTHVPLIANWPAGISAGQVNRDLVDVLDLFPTMLAAGGARPAPQTDGISLLPTLRTGEIHPRRWVFRDYEPRWGRFVPERYVQDRQYKLYHDGRFFDYVADPLQRNPLTGAEVSGSAERARSILQVVLDRYAMEIGRPVSKRIGRLDQPDPTAAPRGAPPAP